MRERFIYVAIGCLILGIVIAKIFPLWLIIATAVAITVVIYLVGRDRRTV